MRDDDLPPPTTRVKHVYILVQNVSGHTLKVDGDMFENGRCGVPVTIPPGGIAKAKRQFFARRRVHPEGGGASVEQAPIAKQLTGGMLQPYDAFAKESAEMFVDELPEVVHAVVSAGKSTIAWTVPDPQAARDAEALAYGRAMLEKHKLRAAATPPPPTVTVMKPEDVDPADAAERLAGPDAAHAVIKGN